MQFNKLDDLVDYVLGEEYKLKSQKEKLKIRYERAYTMCKMCGPEHSWNWYKRSLMPEEWEDK